MIWPCTCPAGVSKLAEDLVSGIFGPLSLLTRPRRDSPTLIEHVVTEVSDRISSDQQQLDTSEVSSGCQRSLNAEAQRVVRSIYHETNTMCLPRLI